MGLCRLIVVQAVNLCTENSPGFSMQATAQTDEATEVVASIESIESCVACVVEKFKDLRPFYFV